jgi:hypothetical protein
VVELPHFDRARVEMDPAVARVPHAMPVK